MTAPLYAGDAAPLSLDRRRQDAARHEADRRAAVAAHPASGPPVRERQEALLADLLDQAYLFDDPDAYAAGVRDAYERFAAASISG